MKENNDSSKSTTLTLLHSWAKLNSKAKQGHHNITRETKETKETQDKQTQQRQKETHTTQKDSKLQGYP